MVGIEWLVLTVYFVYWVQSGPVSKPNFGGKALTCRHSLFCMFTISPIL